MVRTSQRQDSMPAVGGTPDVSATEVEIVGTRFCPRVGCANPQYGRQYLRRPEDGLRVESLLWVSCEKKAPSDFETRYSPGRVSRYSGGYDIRFRSRYCVEDIPRQSRAHRPLAVFCKCQTNANQTQTFYYFPTETNGGELHPNNCDYFWLYTTSRR
jgi:hypothetical protein